MLPCPAAESVRNAVARRRAYLGSVACLLVGSGLLQNMSCQDVSDVMATMGKEPFDGAAAGVGIVDAVSLDRQPPSLIERRLIVSSVNAGRLYCLDEQRARVGCATQQHLPMSLYVGVEIGVEIKQIRQHQAKRLLPEEG